ncbi:MAG: glycosyltransferase, partial [Pseudonocardiaceae bacterium]
LDLFIASSEQETFGLSVLEALANGIPALYTTCPAMDGISTQRARQVPGDIAGLRREIETELASGRRPREEVPAIRERYGIEAVTRRIDDLYDRLMARKQPRHQPGDSRVAPNPLGGNG